MLVSEQIVKKKVISIVKSWYPFSLVSIACQLHCTFIMTTVQRLHWKREFVKEGKQVL